MEKIKLYNRVEKPSSKEREKIINFLFNQLDHYGDTKEEISKAISYSLEERPSFGGFVTTLYQDKILIGAVVVNKTGMDGYIPENILVYIAIDQRFRGRGIGKRLMKIAMNQCEGGIALHVEHDNPAFNLYRSLGFTNKYLEMRYKNIK